MRTKMLWAAVASLLTAGLVSGMSMQSATAETDGGGIVPVTNWRLFETTSTTPMYSGQTKTLQVTGIGGVPSSGVSAVVVSVSASSAKSVYVTVAPSGSGQTHSQLSVQENAGWDSNTAIVRVSSAGKVDLSVSGGATQVKLDIQGYVSSDATTADGGFVAITQARIARSDTGEGFASTAALVGGWNYVVDVAGVGGVPSDASAVFANVRVFSATGSGGLRVGPSTLTAGSQSALIYQASGAYDSAALVRLGTDGKVRLFANAGTNVHVMIDVQGYVTPGDDGAGFTPIVPQSILTADAPGTEIESGETREVQVTGVSGIPEVDDVGAAMFDFIATTWTSTGSLSLYDADDPESSVYQLRVEGSSTNVPERTTVIARVSANGMVNVTNHGTTPVGVRLAVQGWFSPTASQEPQPTPTPSETGPAPADPEQYAPEGVTQVATVTEEIYSAEGDVVSTVEHGPETEGQILGSGIDESGTVTPAGSGSGTGGSSSPSGCRKPSLTVTSKNAAGYTLYTYKQWTYWCWNRATQTIYNQATGWGVWPSSIVSWEGHVTTQKLFYDYGTNNGHPRSAYKHYRKGHLTYNFAPNWNYYPELLIRSYYNGTYAWYLDER